MNVRRTGGTRQASISEVVTSLIGTLRHAARVREGMAVNAWDDVVGPRAAAATHAVSARDGILQVRTRNSVWSQELALLKPTILEGINRRVGGAVIRDIHFKLGKIPERHAPEAMHPDQADLRAVQLTDGDRRSLAHALAGLAAMSDQELRSSLADTIETRLRLRRWRLQHGWRECSDCGGAHAGPSTLCPICRLPVNERIGPSTARL